MMASPRMVKEKIQRSVTAVQRTLDRFGLAIPDGIQALIWLLGVAVFIGLTMRSAVPLMSSYLSEAENVQIQTKTVNEEYLQPPQFVLRLPHFLNDGKGTALGRISDHLQKGTEAHCVECQLLANASWDVWRGANMSMTNFDTIYYSLINAFVRKLLLSSDIGPLKESNYLWNVPIVETAFHFLMRRHWLDINFTNIRPLTDFVGSNYTNGTFINMLFYASMKGLCHLLPFSISCQTMDTKRIELSCEDLFLNRSNHLLVKRDWLAIPLPRNLGDVCELRGALMPYGAIVPHYNGSIWTRPGDESNAISLYVDPLFPYFTNGPTVNDYLWNPLASAEGANGKVAHFEVQFSASMRTKEERDENVNCYKDASPWVCVARCVKQVAIQRCNCLPLTIHVAMPAEDRNVRAPYCTYADYDTCNSDTFAIRQQCIKDCSNPCEYTYYNFLVHSDQFDAGPLKREMGIRGFLIRISQFNSGPLVQFSNITKNNGDDILSQVGGVMGLYLGITGLSVLTFFINIFDFVQRYHQGRRDRRKRKTWAVQLFRMAAVNRLIGQSTGNNDGEDGNECTDKQCSPDDRTQEQIKVLTNELEKTKSEMALYKSGFDMLKNELERMKVDMSIRHSSNGNSNSHDSTLVHRLKCGE